MTRIYFNTIKEKRGNYFIEYMPHNGNKLFANLNLIFYKKFNYPEVRSCMESEAQYLVHRYPIPVMVTAFDKKGDEIEIDSSLIYNCLVVWMSSEKKFVKKWGLIKDEELPDDALSPEYLLKTYHNIDYKTEQKIHKEVDAKWKRKSHELKVFWGMIFLWAVVIPGSVALLGWSNPIIGVVVTVYAFGKAAWKGGQLLGWIKPTIREQDKKDKERRMDYYFYHCEKNPEGFRRLLIENLEQDEQENIKAKVEDLKKRSNN